jgi:hypothetical protein
MQLSDHSLRQIDEAYLERLGDAALRALSAKLLVDLKEARERLSQSRRNSSLPPSREAPWEKTRPADATMAVDEPPEATVDTATGGPSEGCAGAWTPRPATGGCRGIAWAGGVRGVRGESGGTHWAGVHGL